MFFSQITPFHFAGEMTTADGGAIVYSMDHLHIPSVITSLANHFKYIRMMAGIK
jgi:hypothetical protein